MLQRKTSFFEPSEQKSRTEALREVARRLAAEVENADHHHDEEEGDGTPVRIPPSQSSSAAPSVVQDGADPSSNSTTPQSRRSYAGLLSSFFNSPAQEEKKLDEDEKTAIDTITKDRGVHMLAADFAIFSSLQNDLITNAITSGNLTDCSAKTRLRVHTPQPSVYQAYGRDYVRGQLHTDPILPGPTPPLTPWESANSGLKRRKLKIQDFEEDPDGDDEEVSVPRVDMPLQTKYNGLVMVYSLVFALR